MAIRVDLHDKELMRRFRKSSLVGLQRAGLFAHTQMRLEVNKSNIGGTQPSLPGEPPRKGTGFGQSQIVFESNDSERDPAVRIGVTKNGFYMFLLEIGTRFIAKRPWLLATVLKNKRQIAALAATGGKREIG